MLLGDHNPWIGLVVLEQHIVVRLVLLYKRIFKIERILLGRHYDITHIGYVAHKQHGPHGVVGAVEV